MYDSSASAQAPAPNPPAVGGALRTEDREFALMQQVYQAGGLCDGDRVARSLRRHRDQPVSVLARWIVERRIVNFNHQGTAWIPLFQFDPASMDITPAVAAIVAELAPAFDDWDLALWFASPNESLQGAAPATFIAQDPGEVLVAARIDCFIARG